MPRKNERKFKRGRFGKGKMMAAASEAVRNGEMSSQNAAGMFEIAETTIVYYMMSKSEEPPARCSKVKATFTVQQAEDLKHFLSEVDKLSFGLTHEQCCKLVYEFAEKERIPHSFCHSKRMAGLHWFKYFKTKHNFKLGGREGSPGRCPALGFRDSLERFFDVLGEVRRDRKLTGDQIYHAFEMGFSIVSSEKRYFSSLDGSGPASGTSYLTVGESVSALCCAKASGEFVPPLLVFPRETMQLEYLNGTTVGTIAVAERTGSLTEFAFLLYLRHFLEFAKPSAETPSLLLIDNKPLLVSPSVVMFAREHNIILMGFPRHVPYKLQPLTVTFIENFKMFFIHAIKSFAVAHRGCVVTDKDVGSLFGYAYLSSANPEHAIKGFKDCGIEPFNPGIFEELPLND